MAHRPAPAFRLYHGTAHAFGAFSEASLERGVAANSALGVHLTEDPHLAAEYAELATRDGGAGEPRVLVVEVAIEAALVISNRAEFLGLDLTGEPARSREAFAQLRRDLIDQGWGAVAVDEAGDDLAGAWAILEPERTKIVGSLPIASLDDRAARAAIASEVRFRFAPLLFDEADAGTPAP